MPLARALAARGVTSDADLRLSLEGLTAPAELSHVNEAAILLADAIEADAKLLIVADYDCDGATACAVGLRGLRMLAAGTQASIDYLVPNRFEYGYGLTPEIVELAARRAPDLLITVDNGIASVEGVARANDLGIEVLITDHHLPGG
jgi:single-stranded-DNA-specific exonuclease